MSVARFWADASCPPVVTIDCGDTTIPVLNPSLWSPEGVAAFIGRDLEVWLPACTELEDQAILELLSSLTVEDVECLCAAVEDATGQTAEDMEGVLNAVETWGTELAADFQRFYGRDLRDLWRDGGISYATARAMIKHLPPESAFVTARRDLLEREDFERASSGVPEGWGVWSHTDELLAGVAERLDGVICAIGSVHGANPQQPERIRRPGVGYSTRELREHRAAVDALIAYAVANDGAAPPGWVPAETVTQQPN